MKKIRWGVLSTANIGLEKVIPAMQQGEYLGDDDIERFQFNDELNAQLKIFHRMLRKAVSERNAYCTNHPLFQNYLYFNGLSQCNDTKLR